MATDGRGAAVRDGAAAEEDQRKPVAPASIEKVKQDDGCRWSDFAKQFFFQIYALSTLLGVDFEDATVMLRANKRLSKHCLSSLALAQSPKESVNITRAYFTPVCIGDHLRTTTTMDGCSTCVPSYINPNSTSSDQFNQQSGESNRRNSFEPLNTT